MTRFSVVIPLYNKQAFIAATLATVRAQTLAPLEVLIIDDGSADGGAATALAGEVAGLRVIRQANAGPGLARNRGIAEARGDWIAFLDADDLWLPDHLETLASIIAAYPQSALVGSGFVRGKPDELGKITRQRAPSAPPREADLFAGHEPVWTSAVAVRADVARSSGGFPARWPGEDQEFWVRLALAHPLAMSDRVTAIYVQETGGAMDSLAGDPPIEADDGYPLFATLAGALADERHRPRWPAITAYWRSILLSYVRPSLYQGQTATARAYLARHRMLGGQTPLGYAALSTLPPGVLRFLVRGYARIKHAALGAVSRSPVR